MKSGAHGGSLLEEAVAITMAMIQPSPQRVKKGVFIQMTTAILAHMIIYFLHKDDEEVVHSL